MYILANILWYLLPAYYHIIILLYCSYSSSYLLSSTITRGGGWAGWRSFRGKEPDGTKERDSRMTEETNA